MTKTELKACWDSVLDLMRKKVDPLAVDTFFKPLSPIKISEREQKLFLLAPKQSNYAFYQSRVNNHMSSLSECMNSVFGKVYTIEVTEKESLQDTEDPFSAEDSLNPKYTFESFVDGPNNRLAYAASVSVARVQRNHLLSLLSY